MLVQCFLHIQQQNNCKTLKRTVMKSTIITLVTALMGMLSVDASAQTNTNIINQYGPPTFTGGTVSTPSESFALYQETKVAENPVTRIRSVYPDPARTASSVILEEQPVKPVALYIFNLNGTLMKTYNYDGGNMQLNFDVSDLQDGIYNIQVQEEGKSMQSIKLLKQN